MIGKISGFFWRIAGWKTFLAALIVYMIFGAVIMPGGAKKFQEISGKDKVEILDLQLSYTPEKARAIIADYGDAGRSFASKFEMIADSIYPLIYTFLFIITIAWIYKTLARYGIVFSYIHLVPILGMLADYCENIGIIYMLKGYPDFPDTIANVASVFTSIKWGFVVLESLIIIVGIVLLVYKKFAARQTSVV